MCLGREVAISGRRDRGERQPNRVTEAQPLERHHRDHVQADQHEQAADGKAQPVPKVENDAAPKAQGSRSAAPCGSHGSRSTPAFSMARLSV